MQIETRINGRMVTLEAPPGEFLAETLRRYGYLSVKQGCETGSCGLCTIWMDGRPVLSCCALTVRAGARDITTIEGVLEEAEVFARCMAEEGAEQCGFCTPGLTMTVLAMKRELTEPTEAAINRYLSGNLCRCSGYQGQMRAIKKFMGMTACE